MAIFGDIPRVRFAYGRILVLELCGGVEGVTDFSILDIPVLDEWNYPRHHRGVTEHPGLYAVGLPWLTGHGSAIVAGVGRDAEYIAQHIARNSAAR
jgi:hypothetical protein